MKMFARVENGKIIDGPMAFPENYLAHLKSKSEVTAQVAKSGWFPVIDNSLEVDRTTTAVSDDYTIEILPDKVIKTHRTKPFPQAFIDAYDRFVKTVTPPTK